jgi:hypothetical protein
MFATTLAAISSLQMILFGKNNISFFRVIEVAFFSGDIAVVVHMSKIVD